jgi:hypothetical protein
MIAKSLLIVVAAASLAVMTAPADAKSRKRHKAPKIVHIAPVSEYEAIRQRALLLHGGCVTDEGYGRFSPCDRARPD